MVYIALIRLNSSSHYYVHIFCLSLAEERIWWRKKAIIPRSLLVSQHEYTNEYFVDIFTYMYAEYLVHLNSSGPAGGSTWTLGSPWVPYMQWVCVCAYIHPYTHIHSHPRQKLEKIQTILLSYSCQNKAPRQQEVPCIDRLAEPTHPHPPTLMDKLCTHERTCTPCGGCVSKYLY